MFARHLIPFVSNTPFTRASGSTFTQGRLFSISPHLNPQSHHQHNLHHLNPHHQYTHPQNTNSLRELQEKYNEKSRSFRLLSFSHYGVVAAFLYFGYAINENINLMRDEAAKNHLENQQLREEIGKTRDVLSQLKHSTASAPQTKVSENDPRRVMFNFTNHDNQPIYAPNGVKNTAKIEFDTMITDINSPRRHAPDQQDLTQQSPKAIIKL